ncbi:MAG: hypothetical protein ACJAXH_001553 [Colwellia sp.]
MAKLTMPLHTEQVDCIERLIVSGIVFILSIFSLISQMEIDEANQYNSIGYKVINSLDEEKTISVSKSTERNYCD